MFWGCEMLSFQCNTSNDKTKYIKSNEIGFGPQFGSYSTPTLSKDDITPYEIHNSHSNKIKCQSAIAYPPLR